MNRTINIIQTYIIHSTHFQLSSLLQYYVGIRLQIQPLEILLCLFRYNNMGFRRPVTLSQLYNFDLSCNLSQCFFLYVHQQDLLFHLSRLLERKEICCKPFCRWRRLIIFYGNRFNYTKYTFHSFHSVYCFLVLSLFFQGYN